MDKEFLKNLTAHLVRIKNENLIDEYEIHDQTIILYFMGFELFIHLDKDVFFITNADIVNDIDLKHLGKMTKTLNRIKRDLKWLSKWHKRNKKGEK